MEEHQILNLLLVVSFLQSGHCQYAVTSVVRTTISYMETFDFTCGENHNRMCIWGKITDKTSRDSVAILRYVNTIRDYSLSLENPLPMKPYPMTSIPASDDNNLSMTKMKRHIGSFTQIADRAFDTFYSYIDRPASVDDALLSQLLRRECSDVNKALIETTTQIIPTANAPCCRKSFPVLYAELSKTLVSIGPGTSYQQFLLEIYEKILLAEAKSMMVLTFCGKLEQSTAQGWNTLQRSLMHNYKQRHNIYRREFFEGIAESSRWYRAGEPPKEWAEGVSFFQLEKFNQATFFRRGRYFGHCNRHADYMNEQGVRQLCENTPVDAPGEDCYVKPEHVCWGTLFNCFYFYNPIICPLKNDIRRFLWITIDIGRKAYNKPFRIPYGRSENDHNACPGCMEIFDNQFCMCHCLGAGNRISFIPARSGIRRNRVIVAVRLAYQDNIVFVQIKEGLLGPNATIIETFDTWKPSAPPHTNYTVRVHHVDDALNLNSLQGLDNEVLIAVGFTRAKEQEPSTSKKRRPIRMELTILVAEFDCRGNLRTETRNVSSSVHYNDLFRVQPHNPMYGNRSQIISNTSAHYMKFQRSFLICDAGQATLPLFDSVPVETTPPVALSGVALIHKGTPNFAGFLSLKVLAINSFKCFTETMESVS